MNSCHHKSNLSPHQTLLYCLTTSSCFVASLYIFVPPAVQRLPRDDPLHIRWRSAVIVAFVFICISIYPWLFCQAAIENDDNHDKEPSFLVYLGIVRQQSLAECIVQDVKILLHACILYLGSFSCTWIEIYQHACQLQRDELTNNTRISTNSSNVHSSPTPLLLHMIKSIQQTVLQPKLSSLHQCYTNQTIRWIHLRNLLIAPIVEEIVFRSLLLPPLLSHYTTTQSAWIAPLFFGVAHFHHHYTKRHLYADSKHLMASLVLQWGYTTLFGAYASHVFVRTGSLWGVCAVHSICNWMGLPEVGFVRKGSMLFGYRWLIGILYGVGISMFVRLFDSEMNWFPEVSVIGSLVRGA